MQVKSNSECSIISTFIKIPFSIKTFVLFISKWPLKTGFTVIQFQNLIKSFNQNHHLSVFSKSGQIKKI